MSLNRALAVSALVGPLAWAVMWFSTDARAGWDSLVYHKYAFEYAGLPAEEQDALSWDLFARYAEPTMVLYVSGTLGGEKWHFETESGDRRWALQYRMRPAYPALVAAAYPLLGTRAPLAVSAFSVVLLLATTLVGIQLLAGFRVAVIATGLAIFNILFAPWLVALMTDGLAISLWAVTLTTGSLWVAQGRAVWLAALGLAVLALCLTRPLGILAPLVFGLGALAAGLARAVEWPRFVVATLTAAVPALAVTAFFAAAGFPGFPDLLQDLPTVHFSSPDIADPVGWTLNNIRYQLSETLLIGLLARPLVVLVVVASIVGLLLVGRWWTVPFLAALAVVPIAYFVHPETSELARTLAPAWVSVHAGLALLIVFGAIKWRTRVLEYADSFTQPEARIPSG